MTSIALPTPDASIVARRPAIVAELQKLLGADRVIGDEDGRRAFETDALTAYRCMPLAVVLPRSTEEVATALKYCHANGVKVVARGAGTSLAGGALPSEDAIVIAVSKMKRVLDLDYPEDVRAGGLRARRARRWPSSIRPPELRSATKRR